MNPSVEFAGYLFVPGGPNGDDYNHGDFKFYFQNKGSVATGPNAFNATSDYPQGEQGVQGWNGFQAAQHLNWSGMRLRITFGHSVTR